MKAPKSYSEAVAPLAFLSQKVKETFTNNSLQVDPILYLDKEYENYDIK